MYICIYIYIYICSLAPCPGVSKRGMGHWHRRGARTELFRNTDIRLSAAFGPVDASPWNGELQLGTTQTHPHPSPPVKSCCMIV